jgi:hypothetical protein
MAPGIADRTRPHNRKSLHPGDYLEMTPARPSLTRHRAAIRSELTVMLPVKKPSIIDAGNVRVNDMTRIKAFLRGEDGAVTVDWVVLTASIISMSLVVLLLIYQATDDASAGLTDSIVETAEAASTGT